MIGSASPATGHDHALREREQHAPAAFARTRRARALGRPSEAEIARMLAEFSARGGHVTRCAPAHLVPVNNGAGRDAARWVA